MARKDLTAHELEDFVRRHGPGSGAAYLAERQKELEAEKQAEREKQEYERFEHTFVAAGGSKAAAKAAYDSKRNEDAEKAAKRADEAALAAHYSRVRSIL